MLQLRIPLIFTSDARPKLDQSRIDLMVDGVQRNIRVSPFKFVKPLKSLLGDVEVRGSPAIDRCHSDTSYLASPCPSPKVLDCSGVEGLDKGIVLLL